MNVIAKPQLENAILVEELVSIMDNFGINEGGEQPLDDEDSDPMAALRKEQDEIEGKESDVDQSPSPPQPLNPTPPKEEKKPEKKKKKGVDLSGMDDGSLVLLHELKQRMIADEVTLAEIFGGKMYAQQVKTKSKQTEVQLIQAGDLYSIMQKERILSAGIKFDKIKFQSQLCLDNNYKDLILIKKLQKACDEVVSNDQIEARAVKAKKTMGDDEDYGDDFD